MDIHSYQNVKNIDGFNILYRNVWSRHGKQKIHLILLNDWVILLNESKFKSRLRNRGICFSPCHNPSGQAFRAIYQFFKLVINERNQAIQPRFLLPPFLKGDWGGFFRQRVVLYKISPSPSLKKRGIKYIPLTKRFAGSEVSYAKPLRRRGNLMNTWAYEIASVALLPRNE